MTLTAGLRILEDTSYPELDAGIEAAIDFLSVRVPGL